MAKIEIDELGVSCTFPDRPSVRKQLAYWSVVKSVTSDQSLFERAWEGAKLLIEDWECDYMALDTDLDEADDPRMAEVAEAVGMAVFVQVKELEAVPKN